MDTTNLLVKEVEMAFDRYGDARRTQERAMTIGGGVCAALVTLIVKGDLPESAYLLASGFLFLVFLYTGYLSHRKVIAASVLHISEQKLTEWCSREEKEVTLFDLRKRVDFISGRDERGKWYRRLPRYLLVLLLYGVMLFMVDRGLVALTSSNEIRLGAHLAALVLISLSLVLGLAENRHRKVKIKEIEARGLTSPRRIHRVTRESPRSLC